MSVLRGILRQRWAQKTIAVAAAEYLRLVFKTSRLIRPPEQLYEIVDPHLPIILAMWHGQHFLMPFIRRPNDRGKVLVSHHRDGEINALTAEWLNIGIIRGSGDPSGRFDRKGGVGAFKQMIDALEEGYSVAVTADIPKIARRASPGLVKLASMSGRAIYPIAIATSRRLVLDNWDRTTVNLPFGRLGCALGAPIHVPGDVDEAGLETARCAIETSLNAATAQAYALAESGHI